MVNVSVLNNEHIDNIFDVTNSLGVNSTKNALISGKVQTKQASSASKTNISKVDFSIAQKNLNKTDVVRPKAAEMSFDANQTTTNATLNKSKYFVSALHYKKQYNTQ